MSPQNPAIDPQRTALLIMDYQPAVLGSLDDHDQLLTLASGAIDLARQAGITVAHVRVAFADRDPHVHAVLTEKVLPMQAHLITVADLPSLIVTVGLPAAATDTATKVRT